MGAFDIKPIFIPSAFAVNMEIRAQANTETAAPPVPKAHESTWRHYVPP